VVEELLDQSYLVSNKDMAVRQNKADLCPLSDVEASQPLSTIKRPTDTKDPVSSHCVQDEQTQSDMTAAILTEVNTNLDPAPVRWQWSRQTKYEQYELY